MYKLPPEVLERLITVLGDDEAIRKFISVVEHELDTYNAEQSFYADHTLEHLAMFMGSGDDPRALWKAVAYCDAHNEALPIQFVRALVKMPDVWERLTQDEKAAIRTGGRAQQLEHKPGDRLPRDEELAIRAAAFEAAEEFLGWDLEETGCARINKYKTAGMAWDLMPDRLKTEPKDDCIKKWVNWWYGTGRDKPNRDRCSRDIAWYAQFAKKLGVPWTAQLTNKLKD